MATAPATSLPPALSCATAADYAQFIMSRALSGGAGMEQDWLVRLRQRLTERQVDLDEILRCIVDETTRQLHADRGTLYLCLLYTSPSPRDGRISRMPSSA